MVAATRAFGPENDITVLTLAFTPPRCCMPEHPLPPQEVAPTSPSAVARVSRPALTSVALLTLAFPFALPAQTFGQEDDITVLTVAFAPKMEPAAV